MRALTRVVLVTLLVAVFPVYAMAQEADPADVESIDAIMAAVYDVISGGAGELRRAERRGAGTGRLLRDRDRAGH